MRASQRHGDLWDRLTSPFFLVEAWGKVRSNRGAAGADGVSVGAFAKAQAANIRTLSVGIIAGDYQMQPCRRVDIPKRKGGTRRLMIPSVQDRIVHTALAEVLKPILEPLFEDSSFAYRPGRSVKQAVARIEGWRNLGYRHVIEADIVSYFDAIKHGLLLAKLETALADAPGASAILSLISESLEVQGRELASPGLGLVQGSPLSPILANLYLDALDEAMERRGVKIVRYADDFVILCKRRKGADAALTRVVKVLADHGLELYEDGTRIVDFDRGFDFIGYLFVRSLAVKKTYDDDVRDISAFEKPVVLTDKNTEPAKPPAKAPPRHDRGEKVLYLTDPTHALALRNQSFSVRTPEDHEVAAVFHGRVGRIEIGPGVRVDHDTIEHCLATDTELAFVNGRGQTRAWLGRHSSEKAALQLAQAKAILSPDLRTSLARKLVEARIRNQRTQLFRLNRVAQKDQVIAALKAMGRNLRKLPNAGNLDQLRGLEGASAALYWPALGNLAQGATTPFRRKRPATDPLNATINYLTAMLERDIKGALCEAGLHTGFGILHAAHDYNDAAIYDLMEPFRAPLNEGLAAFLFNSHRLKPEMFDPVHSNYVRIHRDARHAIIRGYEQAVAKRVNVTGTKGKLAWRPLMERQALDLARAFRAADPELFQPYLMEP